MWKIRFKGTFLPNRRWQTTPTWMFLSLSLSHYCMVMKINIFHIFMVIQSINCFKYTFYPQDNLVCYVTQMFLFLCRCYLQKWQLVISVKCSANVAIYPWLHSVFKGSKRESGLHFLGSKSVHILLQLFFVCLHFGGWE